MWSKFSENCWGGTTCIHYYNCAKMDMEKDLCGGNSDRRKKGHIWLICYFNCKRERVVHTVTQIGDVHIVTLNFRIEQQKCAKVVRNTISIKNTVRNRAIIDYIWVHMEVAIIDIGTKCPHRHTQFSCVWRCSVCDLSLLCFHSVVCETWELSLRHLLEEGDVNRVLKRASEIKSHLHSNYKLHHS